MQNQHSLWNLAFPAGFAIIRPEDFDIYANPNQYMKENLNKEIYIDATTGEIIGGKFTENL